MIRRQKKPKEVDKHSELVKKLQDLINRIVRAIDYNVKCIYCGENDVKAACHFTSVGSNNSIRFNLHNAFGGDFNCNGIDSRKQFSKSLEKVYSKNYAHYVENLPSLYPEIKLSVHDLDIATKNAKLFLDMILERTDIKTPEDRIKARTEGNKFIGIYLK